MGSKLPLKLRRRGNELSEESRSILSRRHSLTAK